MMENSLINMVKKECLHNSQIAYLSLQTDLIQMRLYLDYAQK